jgi:hypothetical protein
VLQGSTYGSFIGAGVSAIALPMVVSGVFEDDEVARLYAEQRTNPWALFRERPTQIWLGAAASGPTVTALTPTVIGSTTFRPRYTWTP